MHGNVASLVLQYMRCRPGYEWNALNELASMIIPSLTSFLSFSYNPFFLPTCPTSCPTLPTTRTSLPAASLFKPFKPPTPRMHRNVVAAAAVVAGAGVAARRTVHRDTTTTTTGDGAARTKSVNAPTLACFSDLLGCLAMQWWCSGLLLLAACIVTSYTSVHRVDGVAR